MPHGVPVYDFEEFDFYELLGVSRSASPEEIKRAYRREIARYHPDRFVNASPEDLEYARRRSQLLTEAYATLSNPSARNAYNLDRRRQFARRPSRTTPPPTQRDHQAELYQQARDHLDAGRFVQAIAALRQLHRINPFYRDSAELLADAERRLRDRTTGRRSGVSPVRQRRLTLVAGVAAVIVLMSGSVWWLRTQYAPRSADAGAGVVATPATAPSQTLVEPTPTVLSPTVPSVRTTPPLTQPIPEVTVAPPTQTTRAPLLPPTPSPLPPSLEAEGAVILRDDTFTTGWASVRRTDWSVGPRDERYRITAEAQVGVIWSYRSVPNSDVRMKVDVEVIEGEGGVILRFRNEQNYLIFMVAPQTGSFRLEHMRNGTLALMAGGTRDDLRFPDGRFRLDVRLSGEQVRIAVNGQVVVETDVPALPVTSRFGLAVVARDTRSEAWFDNLEIRALP